MSGIPEELIEQVRDAADIVEIVGESVPLKRTGSDYRGPCPVHSGKHRNLAVIPKNKYDRVKHLTKRLNQESEDIEKAYQLYKRVRLSKKPSKPSRISTII